MCAKVHDAQRIARYKKRQALHEGASAESVMQMLPYLKGEIPLQGYGWIREFHFNLTQEALKELVIKCLHDARSTYTEMDIDNDPGEFHTPVEEVLYAWTVAAKGGVPELYITIVDDSDTNKLSMRLSKDCPWKYP
jgi:hypothetical protein